MWVPRCQMCGSLSAPSVCQTELKGDLITAGFVQGAADPCVWTMHGESGEFMGSLAIDTDDTLHEGTTAMFEVTDNIIGSKCDTGDMQILSVNH